MKSIQPKTINKTPPRLFTKSKFSQNQKSTNINILLNRIKMNQKNETRKKLFFSAATSTGIILFGLIIF